jgi:hypothetical protein
VVGALVAVLKFVGGGSAWAGAFNVALAAGGAVYSSQQAKKQKAKAQAQARRAAAAAAEAAKKARQLQKKARFSAFNQADATQIAPITTTVTDSVAPRRLVYGRTRTGGVKVFSHTHTSNTKLLSIIVLGDGPFDDLEELYLDGESVPLNSLGSTNYAVEKFSVTSGNYAGKVVLWFHDGAEGQLANSYVVSQAPGWTTAHTLDGIAYVVVQYDYDLDVFTNGVPDLSVVVRGRRDIADPRDGTTAWTANAALCYAHYLRQDWAGLAATAAEVDEDSLVVAANICDDDVGLAAGGTEKRYSVSGVVTLDRNPEDVMADFEAAMAGGAPYIGDAYRIYAGEYVPPTVEIDEDWLRGSVSVQKRRGRAARANYVKGAYRSATGNYELEDYPARTDADFVTADGARHVRDLPQRLVSSGTQAQRLAEIELQTSRLEEDLSITCDLRALRINAGSTVAVTLSRHGIVSRPYHVQVWELTTSADGEPAVQLTLTRADSAVYDWATSDEIPVVPAGEISTGKPIVSTPTFSPVSGEYPTSDYPGKPITISTTTAGATIRWSNTTIPTGADTGNAYTSPVSVALNDVIFARAFLTGLIPSAGAIAAYTAEVVEEPVASPVGADYDSGDYPVAVSLTCSTAGASIYYTTDGSTPDATDTLYTVAVNVTEGQTLKAIGLKTDSVSSSIMEEVYT